MVGPDPKAMRVLARQLFLDSVAEAGIERAFDRHVDCERGVLRVCDDLFDLHSYARVQFVSIGKAGHSMVEALGGKVGESLAGIVAQQLALQAHCRAKPLVCLVDPPLRVKE